MAQWFGTCSCLFHLARKRQLYSLNRLFPGDSNVTPEKEQEYREEAVRLAELPRDDQRQLIAQHRAIAADKGVPKPDRKEAKLRADTLEIQLKRLARKKRKLL